MFHSIKSKVIVFTLIPLLITLVIVGLLAVVNKQENEQDLTINRLSTFRTLLESGDLSFESLKDVEKLQVLLSEKVEHAEIVKKDATILYTTETTPSPERNEYAQPLISEAFDGVETTNVIEENGKPLLIYVSPIIVGNKIVGVLRIDLANEQTTARVQQFSLLVLGIVAISLLICYFLIAFLLSTTVLDNIIRLKGSTLSLEAGDFDSPIESQSDDEIGELAETLDHMRTEIKSSRKKLESVNKDLERQVHERTAELEQKLDELARLNRFMVDREVKMIELKKELDMLRQSASSQ